MDDQRRQTIEKVRNFWNRAATRNAAWYVSSYTDFAEQRDMNEFWRSGVMIWGDLKKRTGYQPSDSDLVVEIGCGIGRLSRAISPEVRQVEAFDVSEEMLAKARESNLPNVNFHLASGCGLETCADNSAQAVVAYCVFQHLPEIGMLREYLHEMCRVAAPGAIVAFTLSKRDWKHSLLPLFRLRAYLRGRLNPKAPQDVHRKEWIGIRPTDAEVRAACPIALEHIDLDGQRQLYFGNAPLANGQGNPSARVDSV